MQDIPKVRKLKQPDKTELREIRDFIRTNKNISYHHRVKAPFLSTAEAPVEEAEDEAITVASIPSRECSLNYPLRLVPPKSFRAPAIADPKPLTDINHLFAVLKGQHPNIANKYLPNALEESKSNDSRGKRNTQLGVLTSRFAPAMGVQDYEFRALSARRGGHWKNEAMAFFAQACLYFTMLDFEKSVQALKVAAGVFEKLEDKAALCVVYNYLGLAHYHTQHLEEALEFFKTHEALAGGVTASVPLINQGIALNDLRRHQEAAAVLERALDHTSQHEHPMLESLALGNLGLTYLHIGDLHKARDAFSSCLELCALAGDGPGSAVCLLLLGEVFARAKDFPNAAFYFEHTLRVAKESDVRSVAELARVHLGVAKGNEDFVAKVKAQKATPRGALGAVQPLPPSLLSRFDFQGSLPPVPP